jgi:hypothetical protein
MPNRAKRGQRDEGPGVVLSRPQCVKFLHLWLPCLLFPPFSDLSQAGGAVILVPRSERLESPWRSTTYLVLRM